MAIEKQEADFRQLMKRCEEMRKLYTDILVIPELLFQYLPLCCLERWMGRSHWLSGDWLFLLICARWTLGKGNIFQPTHSPRLLCFFPSHCEGDDAGLRMTYDDSSP